MRLNTRIKSADGRIGTVCYNDLDGAGGVWGEHNFDMPPGGYGDNLPQPEFMLRAAYDNATVAEFVPEFEVIEQPESEAA